MQIHKRMFAKAVLGTVPKVLERMKGHTQAVIPVAGY